MDRSIGHRLDLHCFHKLFSICLVFVFNGPVELELYALLYCMHFLDSIYYDINRYGRFAGHIVRDLKFDEQRT